MSTKHEALSAGLDALVGRLRMIGITRSGDAPTVNAAAELLVRLSRELESVLDWAVTEKAPLRAQEIASIRRALTPNNN